MQSREPGLLYLRTEIIKRLLCTFQSVETFDQVAEIEEGKDGFAVDLEVIWLFEVPVDDPVHNEPVIFPIHLTLPDEGIVLIAVTVPVIRRSMVAPEEKELHPVPVAGFQKSVIEG